MSEAGDALRAMAERARGEGGRAAANAMAATAETAIKEGLSRSSHAKGTPTPAPPGGPPALVAGNLRRSVTGTPAESIGDGVWEAAAGPTAKYSAAQNFGAEIRPKNGEYLRFSYGGRMVYVKHVTLPARPFVEAPVRDAAERISQASAHAFYEAVSRA